MTELNQRRKKNAFVCAWNGVCYAFRTERHMKFHGAAGIAVMAGGWILALEPVKLCLLLFAVMAVWVAEIFNTAMERVVDFISPQYRQEAKIIKDLAAGAVFVAAVFAALIGLILFGGVLAAKQI